MINLADVSIPELERKLWVDGEVPRIGIVFPGSERPNRQKIIF